MAKRLTEIKTWYGRCEQVHIGDVLKIVQDDNSYIAYARIVLDERGNKLLQFLNRYKERRRDHRLFLCNANYLGVRSMLNMGKEDKLVVTVHRKEQL